MRLIGAILACAMIFVTLGCSAEASVCQEDQRCWNWTTMGNHERGVVINSIDHRRVNVTRHKFCTLQRAGVIDWKRTEHLHFDPSC